MNAFSFNSIYKSIVSFPTTELPKFVVLTGRNGSGKTHFLEAVKAGHVRSEIAPNPTADVLLFNWNTIIPKDTGRFDPNQDRTRRSSWFQQISTQQDQILPNLQNALISHGVPAELCSDKRKINKLDIDSLTTALGDRERSQAVYQQATATIKAHGNSIYQNTVRHIGDEHYKKIGPRLLQQSPEHFWSTNESKFFGNDLFVWGEVDPFQQAFGRVFTNYRELIQLNDRLEKYPPPGEPEVRYLNEDEFNVRYGQPPWEFVNRILETCNLDFRVDFPPMHETASYEPKLTKISADVEMQFQDLSSGEKVLMSFALCLYNAEESRQEKVFPKLLLLDEVDAPLHPSMAQSLLDTIQTVLVEEKNVSVIITTHSPSTVALAPADSLFEMNPVGPSIRKIDQSSAISLLTSGVPTLSISFDGRRQVFVESKVDARIYDKLYQAYKSEIRSERSLVFLEVGNTTSSGGEQNSGCDQVTRLVDSLVAGGNSSVLGLVDWDNKRSSNGRLQVLSPGIRDGLESLLFDPVLLILLVVRENRQFCVSKNIISDSDSYASIALWGDERWQTAVNTIQCLIEPEYSHTDNDITVNYLSGLKLQLSKKYLHMDDHQLETRIEEVFGFLKPRNRSAGALMIHILESVLTDHRGFLPMDLLSTFELLLADI